MEFFPQHVIRQIDELNRNLFSLERSIRDFSKSSNNLQKRLVFWTKVMAGAIISQIIVIILTTIFL